MSTNTQADRRRLEAESWLAVVRAYQACTRQYARMLEHFDLTLPQFDLMSALRQRGLAATPRDIADTLLVTKGNVTGIVSRLEARGLLRRRPHETDGRSFYCELTAAGIDACDAAQAAAARFIAGQLAPFTDATLEATRTDMTRMREHLDTLDPDALARGAPARSQSQ